MSNVHAIRPNSVTTRVHRAAVQGIVCALFALAAGMTTVAAEDVAPNCAATSADPSKLRVGRVLEIDASGGPVLGQMTRMPREPRFLAPGEVVLTFDDGPMPWITRSILATLATHCTHATFFSVGRMAVAYPGVLREVLDQGHTVGTHTWSHPLNLRRLSGEAAKTEMERGFAAVATAAGRPIAPFFRFPGLSDAPNLVAHLASRHVASITVDVVSNDSFINDPARLARETLARIEASRGGIVLFHDIKPTTAKALPDILRGLADRGFSVVHLVPKAALEPRADLMAQYAPQVARLIGAKTGAAKAAMVPFYGTVGPDAVAQPALVDLPRAPMTAGEAAYEDTQLDEVTLEAPGQSRVWVRPSAAWSSALRRAHTD